MGMTRGDESGIGLTAMLPRKKILLTPFGRVTRFLATTTSPSGGAFKRGAERHAQGDPEADVTQGGSHGHANRHADCDARTWC